LIRETGLEHRLGQIGVAKVAHSLTGEVPQARPEDVRREPLPKGGLAERKIVEGVASRAAVEADRVREESDGAAPSGREGC